MPKRQVLYVAHPVAPLPEQIEERYQRLYPHGERNAENDRAAAQAIIELNCDAALAKLQQLRQAFPETTFIAPWLTLIMAGDDDTDPAARERNLIDDCAVVERCDGIVLTGPRISRGMARERDHGVDNARPGFGVYTLVNLDLSDLAAHRGEAADFNEWARRWGLWSPAGR